MSGSTEIDAARRDLADEFRRRADPSTTGVWREACDLLDQIVNERTRPIPPDVSPNDDKPRMSPSDDTRVIPPEASADV